MATLAERRRAHKSTPKVPESTMTVSFMEGQHLLAESQALKEERDALVIERSPLAQQATGTDAQGQPTGPKLKAGQKLKAPPRLAEIDARLEEIKARRNEIASELAEHQATLGLRGWSGGEWHTWKQEHPPRDGNRFDVLVVSDPQVGLLQIPVCNGSDLFEILGSFAATLDGEPLKGDDWDGWLAESLVYADRRDMVTNVMAMQESRVPRVPKSSPSSPETESSATG